MAWDHLSVTKSHLVYIILGGFTSLFMLCSSVIKERMYIGEATVATICGVIFGPHAANLINPFEWGNTDEVTLEFSRIVLVVQCFAVGVELPKFYMEKHWRSVLCLLLPVMAFGWLITSVFIFLLIPTLNWLDALVCAACVTATDPVLASSVVGKGKFARRVPKHLRDLLSAESGCNDGMAFPFIYLAIYLIQFNRNTRDVSFYWIVYIILYECIFGAIYGFIIGYVARRGIKWAHEHDLIDRESFLSFYFVLSLFCAGSGSILGLDDLLVGFAAGVGFSNDGWFGEKTEESHVSNVIDLLLNLSYFVYLGTIIPWEMYNATDLGLTPWRLVIIAILVIFFRRIPIMLACKPIIPDLKTWREALFAGHFGPIGVGAIFVAILARAELSVEESIPPASYPTEKENPNAILIQAVWPIVTFMVIASIVVHGSSVAVFTLGKRINTLTITLSYTKDFGEDGPEWMRRLPRISSQSRSQAKSASSLEDELKMPQEYRGFLRRKVDESKQASRASSTASRRRRMKWDDGIGPGGPVSQSAIFPQRSQPPEITVSPTSPLSPINGSRSPSPMSSIPVHLRNPMDTEKASIEPTFPDESSPAPPRVTNRVEIFEEGHHLIIEDQDGEVLAVTPSRDSHDEEQGRLKEGHCMSQSESTHSDSPAWTYSGVKSRWEKFLNDERSKRRSKQKSERKHENARAYQYGNTIIVEDEDGEVVKRYELPSQKLEDPGASDLVSQSLKYMGMSNRVKSPSPGEVGPSSSHWAHWVGFGQRTQPEQHKQRRPTRAELEEEDDKHIRFRIDGEDGQRLDKEDFIRRLSHMDPHTRNTLLENSTVAPVVKDVKNAVVEGAPFSSTQKDKKSVTIGPSANFEDSDTAKTGSQSDSPQSLMTRAVPEYFIGRGRSGSSVSAIISNQDVSVAGPSSANPQPWRQARSVLEDLDTEETPAEKRRREAALGVTGNHEDDSDDDNTERVVPSQKRGITWSDVPSKRRQ